MASGIKPNGCSVSIAAPCSAEWRQSPAHSGPWPGRKASRIAEIVLLSDSGCLVQSYIPLKVSPACSCLVYHVGREGVLCYAQTILRPDSKGMYKVTENKLGYRTLISIPNLAPALGPCHLEMPCLCLPISQHEVQEYGKSHATMLPTPYTTWMSICRHADIVCWRLRTIVGWGILALLGDSANTLKFPL